jgi:hypothetical protein
MKNLIVLLFFLSLTAGAYAQVQEVPFTLDDHDRIMRTEEQIKSLRNEMNAKFESVDQRFETMESKFDLIYWLFGVLFALILFLLVSLCGTGAQLCIRYRTKPATSTIGW